LAPVLRKPVQVTLRSQGGENKRSEDGVFSKRSMLDFSLWRRPISLKPGMEEVHSFFGERKENILLRRIS
jgi:hypothetical protein